jgi:hypothetical protein
VGDVCEQLIFKERNVNRREWNRSVLQLNARNFHFCFCRFKCRVGLDVSLLHVQAYCFQFDCTAEAENT